MASWSVSGVVAAPEAAAALGLPSDVAVQSKFEAWKRAEHKAYATVEEEAAALRAFVANDQIIEEHNAKNLSYELGHNAFSDLTWEEFQQRQQARAESKENAAAIADAQARFFSFLGIIF